MEVYIVGRTPGLCGGLLPDLRIHVWVWDKPKGTPCFANIGGKGTDVEVVLLSEAYAERISSGHEVAEYIVGRP